MWSIAWSLRGLLRRLNSMYPIKYVPDSELGAEVKRLKGQLVGIRHKFRWLVEEDGQKYILRPESAKPTSNE